jgi:acetoacetyl-CoA synthetase
MLTPTAPSPLFLLKPGTSAPPIFIAPGHGDDVTELAQFSGKIRSTHPISGLQPKGLAGSDEPQERIEEIAEYFLAAILKAQPEGPYSLVGFSFGGIVMFEVAQQLARRGKAIAFLGLLDAYPHPRFWPLRSWVDVLVGRAKHHASRLLQLPARAAIQHLGKITESLIDHLRMRVGRKPHLKWSAATAAPSPVAKRLEAANLAAWSRYRPQRYHGKITFVQAVPFVLGGTKFPADPEKIWANLCDGFDMRKIHADHGSMVRLHGDAVASVLSECIEEAMSCTDGH